MPIPPFASIHQRCPAGPMRQAPEQPPLRSVCEPHRVIARNGFPGLPKSINLFSQPLGCGVIVIVPMSDEISPREFAAQVALVSDFRMPFDMDEPNPFIIRNQIPNVVAVREDQQFPVSICLGLPALNCLRQPLASVPR